MASHTIAAGEVSKQFTLVASTVDTVTIADVYGYTILTDGTAAVYFTVDGSTPTVAGVNTFPMPAAASTFQLDPATDSHLHFTGTLKLISAGTPVVTVYRS